MVRVITQETYDEVVKENIDEFEMAPEEAVKEAIAQFEAQGVDLSNIIKDLALGSGDDHLVSTTVTRLKELYAVSEINDQEFIKELGVLKTECNKDMARRLRAGKDGAYNILIDLLEVRQKMYNTSKSEKDAVFIVSVLNALTALMEVQPDLLEIKGIDLIKDILDTVKDDNILAATLKWTAVCLTKHEMNRQNLFGKDVVDNIKVLLKEHKSNKKVLSETLLVIRKFTLDDDIRVEFGKAHDHAKELGVQTLEILADLLKENRQPPLVSELMLTIASLLVRNELCASISGSVEDLISVLTDNYDNVSVVQQGYKLITALAGNDDVKRKIVASGAGPIIVALLNRHSDAYDVSMLDLQSQSNPTATALSLKCIAAVTLREPTHSKQLLDNEAPEAIVNAMKVHPDSATVQKNGCWAMRNMVARCREQNAKFHELGVEAILNQAFDKFNKEFGFDIKSALRDLECDVKLDEQWTGKGVQMEK